MGNIENTMRLNTLSASALKKSGALILIYLLSGCALFPPEPPGCTGQFKPVNATVEKDAVINQPVVEGNADNKVSEMDKTLHSEEGVADGK